MTRKTAHTKAYSMLMFITISILAGLLTAGLAIPFAALGAGMIKTASSTFQHLPADLAIPAQNEASEMYLSDGTQLARFFDENREYVPLDRISHEMQQAQIAIEDHRFYQHGAVDLKSIIRAAAGNLADGNISGGGSTLTQQYVKQVRLQMCNGDEKCQQEAQAPNISRKILEMRYAIALENTMSKDKILERYLNIAYYGDGAYGVQAAARHYFNVDAADLNAGQAALLAGIVQNPGQSDPINNLDAALARRDAVLDAQVRYQGASEEFVAQAKAVQFDPSQVQTIGSGCHGSSYPFICDYASRVLTSDAMSTLGPDKDSRRAVLNRAGLKITLTIDPAKQQAAQSVISSVVGPEDGAIAVANTVENSTGRILAMAQSRPSMGEGPGETAYNYSVTNAMGGADGFQFGSTFKTWTAAAAIQQGHFPDTTNYNVQRTMQWKGQTFRGCGDDKFVLGDSFTPTNAVAGHNQGTFNMVTGMMWSVNNYWVAVEKDVGVCQAVDMAKRAGVEIALPVEGESTLDDFDRVPSFVLGAPKVTPLSMASAYGTFGNRGVRCNPIIIESIVDRDGIDIPAPSAECQQTIDPAVADGVNYVLNRTHTSGLSASTNIKNGIDQASKTGTSDNSASASAFVGYTPEISTSVIVAGDTKYWGNTPEQSRDVTRIPLTPLHGRGLAGYGGRGDAGALWRPIMEQDMANMPKSKFTPWVAPKTPR